MEQDNQGIEEVVLSFISYMAWIELVQNIDNTLIQSSIFHSAFTGVQLSNICLSSIRLTNDYFWSLSKGCLYLDQLNSLIPSPNTI